MPARALVFELDAVLDANTLHIEALQHAFLTQGFRVNSDRIASELGQPVQPIVQAILGPLAWHTYGKRIADIVDAEILRHCGVSRLRSPVGTPELFNALRDRGFKLALTSHTTGKALDALLDAAGEDLRSYCDVIVTSDESVMRKPVTPQAPYSRAASELGLHAAQCIAVTHTRFSSDAARRAGMTVIVLGPALGPSRKNLASCVALSEPSPGTSSGALSGTLFGARCHYVSPAALLADLPSALHTCSPLRMDLTADRVADLLSPAFDAARKNLDDGGAPIGAALYDADGNLLAAGANASHKTGNALHHAEIVTLERATGRFDPAAKDTLLVSTLEPCVLCTGAAMEVGVDTVAFALAAPADAGTARVTPPSSPESVTTRITSGPRAPESLELFRDFLARHPSEAQAAFARQLLALHDRSPDPSLATPELIQAH